MKHLTILTLVLLFTLFCNTIFAQSSDPLVTLKPCTQIDLMPKDKKNDPALIQNIKSVLKATDNSAWQGDILKIVVTDNDWILERDKNTGIILARYIRAQVAVRKNGDCWLYHLVTFKEDYNGNKFKNLAWYGTGDRIKIPCKNIKQSEGK